MRGVAAARNKVHTNIFQVIADAAAVSVGADVGQEVDPAAELGQSDGNVEGAAADMLGSPVDDVDQRFTDDQPTRHG
ncbi:hypothetical protein A9W98_22695 [Mycobacterium gordonae]|uniref:Uncharacterized protein n=1 Tax=Mycobacterium gordonae TaxID=1778 RepID=A0A1A6BEZ5_MYCGO|nr:hypothetical protein A9W98_22695 [Mycobacterium gordonae]